MTSPRFQRLFGTTKPVIGMLHLPPLPGAPGSSMSFEEVGGWLLRDVEALERGGADGLLLENFGDAPFHPERVPSHTVAQMSVLAVAVRQATDLPFGISVLRNDGLAALSVASAAGGAFIRVNVWTGARVTDQGILQGEAHRVLRRRQILDADTAVFADVDVKHSAALGDRSLGDQVEEALARGGADAVIVSGEATGRPARVGQVEEAKTAARDAPVLVGSGVTPENVDAVLSVADGVIVGTALKEGSEVTNPVDRGRVRRLVNLVGQVRG